MAIIELLKNRGKEAKKSEEIGIGGFSLMARVTESYTLSSQIPTTWLEDGTNVNDHIILDPLTLTIDGVVSDVFVRREAAIEAITRVQAEIGNLQMYLPTRTNTQAQKVNALINDATDQYRKIDRAVDAGKQVYDLAKGETEKNLREQFLDVIDELHYGKQLISIDMPYRTYDSMRITSVQITRNNEDEAIAFKITAQQMRFADTIYVDASEFFANASDGTGGKTDGLSDKGPQKPKEVTESTLNLIKRTAKSLIGIE